MLSLLPPLEIDMGPLLITYFSLFLVVGITKGQSYSRGVPPQGNTIYATPQNPAPSFNYSGDGFYPQASEYHCGECPLGSYREEVNSPGHCGRCIISQDGTNNYYGEDCDCTQESCPQPCYPPPQQNCGDTTIQCPPPPPLFCPPPPPVRCPPVVCPTKPPVCPGPPKPVTCPTRGPVTFPPLICPPPPPLFCQPPQPINCPPLYCPAPPPQYCPPLSCPGHTMKCPAPPPFQCPPIYCPITYPKDCEYGHNITDYCPPIELPPIICPAPPPVECPPPPPIKCPAARCPPPAPVVCPSVQCPPRRRARPCPQITNCPITCPTSQCPGNNCFQGDDPNVGEGSKGLPSLMVIDPAKVTGKVGDRIVLNCSTQMDDKHLKIIWKMNNLPSPPKHISLSRDGYQLIINSLEEQDEGIYFCVGLNNETQSYAKAQIIVENNNEPDNENITPTYQTMRSSPGSSVSLQCQGQWSRRNGVLPVTSKIEENGALTLTSVGEGDTGIYLCSSDQSGNTIGINFIVNSVGKEVKCGDKEFLCKSGDKCVPQRSRCNAVDDCKDGSDELNCQ